MICRPLFFYEMGCFGLKKQLIFGFVLVLMVTCFICSGLAASLSAEWADDVVTLHCGSSGYFQVLVDGVDTGRWLGTGRSSMTWKVPEDNKEHTASLYSVSYGTANVTFFAGKNDPEPEVTAAPVKEPAMETEAPTEEMDTVTEAPAQVTETPTKAPANENQETTDETNADDEEQTLASEVTAVPVLTIAAPSEETEDDANQSETESFPIIYYGKKDDSADTAEYVYEFVQTSSLHDLKNHMTMEEVFEVLGQAFDEEESNVVVRYAEQLLFDDDLDGFEQMGLKDQLYYVVYLLTDNTTLLSKISADQLVSAVHALDVLQGIYGPITPDYAERVKYFYNNNGVEDVDGDYMTLDLLVDVTSCERYVFVKSEEDWVLESIYTSNHND